MIIFQQKVTVCQEKDYISWPDQNRFHFYENNLKINTQFNKWTRTGPGPELVHWLYNGNSVVDYCIISDELFDKVLYFQVENHISFLSDHAKLNVKLYAKFIRINIENTYTLHDLPSSWKWTDTSCSDFKIALSSFEIKKKIDSFERNPSQNVDQMLTSLNDIIYMACNQSMKKKGEI